MQSCPSPQTSLASRLLPPASLCLIDGQGRAGLWQASVQHALSGRVLAAARSQHLSDDHLTNTANQPEQHAGKGGWKETPLEEAREALLC